MIAPAAKLFGLTAVTGIPLALWHAFGPTRFHGAIPAIIGTLLLMLIYDALRARNAIPDGVALHATGVTRLTLRGYGEVRFRLENTGSARGRWRIGLELPDPIRSDLEFHTVFLRGHGEAVNLNWPCTAVRRGFFRSMLAFIETTSPFGFWRVRWPIPAEAEIRVYPDLSNDRKALAGLFLKRQFSGIHVNRILGKGREFEQLREYIPGDNYDDIHWKVSAKRQKPVTKMYQIEQTQRIYIAIDASRLSARLIDSGTTDDADPQIERSVSAALVTALAAEKQGDLFGIIVFDDQVRKFIRAGRGREHYAACRDALYTVQPRQVNPNYEELYTFLRMNLNRRSLIVILTLLDDPVLSENFIRYAGFLARRHVVLTSIIRQPSIRPLFQETHAECVEDVYRDLAGHIIWHRQQILARSLHRNGIAVGFIDHSRLCPEIVTQYLGIRRRQLL